MKTQAHQPQTAPKRASSVAPKFALVGALVMAAAFSGGCSNLSAHDRNTIIGAGASVLGGAVLTGGSALGVVGGAAVGGVIGNQVRK